MTTDERETIVLTFDDNEEVECEVVATFPLNGKTYIALVELDEDGEIAEDADILLYNYVEGENDEFELNELEDEDEFNAASDELDRIIEEAEAEND